MKRESSIVAHLRVKLSWLVPVINRPARTVGNLLRELLRHRVRCTRDSRLAPMGLERYNMLIKH
jgi:hypothetical protein